MPAGTPLHDECGRDVPAAAPRVDLLLVDHRAVLNVRHCGSCIADAELAPRTTDKTTPRNFHGDCLRTFFHITSLPLIGECDGTEVIGAGLGRTGTMTLKNALEMLGFGPCHHMYEVIQHPSRRRFGSARREANQWIGKRSSPTTAPAATGRAVPSTRNWRRDIRAAKVILTLRDPHAWYRSVCNTILPAMKGPLFAPDGRRVGPPGNFAPLLIGERTFGNDFEEAHMVGVFKRHNEEVKHTIAPERLLVFEAAQGWEPLCRFLGVPVPAEPFPRTNSTEEFQKRASGRREQVAS